MFRVGASSLSELGNSMRRSRIPKIPAGEKSPADFVIKRYAVKKENEFPKRKKNRLDTYDYSSCGAYFITICTEDRRNYFWENVGAIIDRPENIELSSGGEIVNKAIQNISSTYPAFMADWYVIMPNHVHIIFDVRDCEKKNDLEMVIGQYKMSVTKEIRKVIPKFQIWQRSFHDHVIRNQHGYEKIWMYIDNNPIKWEEDCFYIQMEENEAFREGH